jgi:hypothetical protein
VGPGAVVDTAGFVASPVLVAETHVEAAVCVASAARRTHAHPRDTGAAASFELVARRDRQVRLERQPVLDQARVAGAEERARAERGLAFEGDGRDRDRRAAEAAAEAGHAG